MVQCNGCGATNHIRKVCPNRPCSYCGREGHTLVFLFEGQYINWCPQKKEADLRKIFREMTPAQQQAHIADAAARAANEEAIRIRYNLPPGHTPRSLWQFRDR